MYKKTNNIQQLTEEKINHQFQTIRHIREILKECESAFLKYRELLAESDCGIVPVVDSNPSELKKLIKKYGGGGYTLHCDRDGTLFETTPITLNGNNSKFKYNRHL